jgi:hypothetical protein
MGLLKSGAAVFAAAIFAAQPCAAADDIRDSGAGDRSVAAFAGMSLRLPVGEARRARPTARLQFTTSYAVRDARTGSTATFRAPGLEIGAGKAGKAAFFLNGEKAADVQGRMGLGGTGTTLLVVGGVLLGVVVVALAAGGAGIGDTCPIINGSRDHCINP